MSQNRIYFRADGDGRMGLGHVIRSLALASMLKEDYQCIFLIRDPLPVLRAQILDECHWLIELPDHKKELEEAQFIFQQYLQPTDIIVLDGYHFTTDYQVILKDSGATVVCIDDIHAYHFVADAVINHAPGLNPAQYSVEKYTQLFLGLDYSLLRPPFLKAAQELRTIQQIDTAFICFGGADFNNLSLKALQAIAEQSWINKAHVVLGGVNQNLESIEDFARSQHRLKVHIHRNLSAAEMVRFMQDSQLAIVPASSTLYEAVAVNMLIICGYYVDNQIGVYEGFQSLGLIQGVGDFNTFTDYTSLLDSLKNTAPEPIFQKQRKYLHGQSKAHFLEIFKSLVKSKEVHITHRRARADDLLLYFNWANEAGVREQSLSPTSILLEDHTRWFLQKLDNEHSFLYLFFSGPFPIGQVRFEIEGSTAIINYSVDAQMRGKAFGKKMLSLAMAVLLEETKVRVQEYYGIVKKENIPSRKIFEGLNFQIKEQKLIQGVPCMVYTKKVYDEKY